MWRGKHFGAIDARRGVIDAIIGGDIRDVRGYLPAARLGVSAEPTNRGILPFIRWPFGAAASTRGGACMGEHTHTRFLSQRTLRELQREVQKLPKARRRLLLRQRDPKRSQNSVDNPAERGVE